MHNSLIDLTLIILVLIKEQSSVHKTCSCFILLPPLMQVSHKSLALYLPLLLLLLLLIASQHPGATAITFNIKANGEATPAPGLKMILQKAETGNYCGAEPTTGAITTDWMKVTVPIAAFECGIGLEQLTQFEFQNPTGGDVPVCIADIAIER